MSFYYATVVSIRTLVANFPEIRQVRTVLAWNQICKANTANYNVRLSQYTHYRYLFIYLCFAQNCITKCNLNQSTNWEKFFSHLVELIHEDDDNGKLLQHFEREDRLGDEAVGDVLGPVRHLLLRGDGGDGEGLAEQRLNVQLGELLHLDDAARLKDLVQMVGQLVVDGFDELQKVGDLLHTITGF
jgi:hypothetical protein